MFSLKASLKLGGSLATGVSTTTLGGKGVDEGSSEKFTGQDYETRLGDRQGSEADHDPLLFPACDLEMNRVPRLVSRQQTDFDAREGYVVTALGRATNQFTTVIARYDKYDGKQLLPSDSFPQTYQPDSPLDAAINVAEPLDPALLDAKLALLTSSSSMSSLSSSTGGGGGGSTLKKKRRALSSAGGATAPHLSLFAGSSKKLTPSAPSDGRSAAALPRSGAAEGAAGGVQALVSVKQVGTVDGVRQLEPLFLSVAAFDAKRGLRLTESVHLSVNPPEIAMMLGEQGAHTAPELKATKALFPLESLSPDVYLVFVLEKTLRAASVDETMDELYRHSQLKPRQQARLEDDYHMSAARLASYRQPLAWAARSLFEKGRSVLGQNICVDDFTRVRSGVALDDVHLLAALERLTEKEARSTLGSAATLRRHELESLLRSGRAGAVPFQVIIDVDLIETGKVMGQLLTPSLEPAYGISQSEEEKNPEHFIRAAQAFRAPDSVSEPNRDVVNDMFVFMDWANLSKAGRRVKTVVIRVTLHADARTLDPDSGLEVFYGRFGPRLDRSHVCAVQYHEKKLAMYEQIKLRLPPVLKKDHHLLFTFSQLECRLSHLKQVTAEEPMSTVFAYATFQVFPDMRVVQDGAHEVPIALASSFPTSRYLSDNGSVEHLNGPNVPLLGFRTHLVSTLYTSDAVLDAWLRTPIQAGFSPACDVLNRAATHVKIQYMPVIFDRLWEVMAIGDEATSLSALLQMAKICEALSSAWQKGLRSSVLLEEHSRNPYLATYIDYEYEESFSSFEGTIRTRPRPLHEVLVERLSQLTRSSPADAPLIGKHLWFFLEIVVKSVTLHLHRDGTLNSGGTVPRSNRVSDAFLGGTLQLVLHLGKHVKERVWMTGPMAKHANKMIALFIKDLLSLVDRGWAMETFRVYLDMIQNGPLAAELQWTALRIVSDHPHWVALSLPFAHKLAPNVQSILSSFYEHHFFIGLLLRYFRLALGGPVQVRAVSVIRELLRKHDHDPRYQSSKLKERVARMYFPLLSIVLEKIELLGNGSMEEAVKQDLLISVLWLLKNVKRRKLLAAWWKSETIKTQRAFLVLMQLCAQSFSSFAPAFVVQVIRLVQSLTSSFMKDLQRSLRKRDNKPLMDDLFGVFVQLLKLPINDFTVLKVLMHSIRELVLLFPEPLFVFPDTSYYCGELIFLLLPFVNVRNGNARAGGAALLYLLMCQNFAARGNFARVKLQATIAVSRFTGNTNTNNTVQLQTSLEAVAKRALQDYGETPFASQVQQVATTLFRVIQDSAKIHEFKSDRERMCDYMYQISLGYAGDSPDLRLTWLNNLADYHLAALNYEEHAQCKILAAALICQFLHMQDADFAMRMGVPRSDETFQSVCPNVTAQPPLQKYEKTRIEEGMFESRCFSHQGLIELIKESLMSLRQGKRFELAIQVYEVLVTMLQYQHKYALMATAFQDMNDLTSQLIETEAQGFRSLSAFYRVAFLGRNWGEKLDNKTFIYKTDEFSRIGDVTDLLEHQLQASFSAAARVERLPNSVALSQGSDPSVCYWQIAAVAEYFEEDELRQKPQDSSGGDESLRRAGLAPNVPEGGSLRKRNSLLVIGPRQGGEGIAVAMGVSGVSSSLTSRAAFSIPAPDRPVVPWSVRTTHWERKFNVQKFLLIQPFTKTEGDSEGHPENQFTRKTFFTCEQAFPLFNTRQVVSEIVVEELSPIETAIEQIQQQTRSICLETEAMTDLNQLQRLLQGALCTSVNLGVLHLARVFLTLPVREQCSRTQVTDLVHILKDFLTAARAGVVLNSQLISSEQLELQRAYESGLASIGSSLGDLFGTL